jgi:magnesium-transporting ATPase (P-type)
VGDKTPADLVLFGATDLKVDNSSLTGESEPQERQPLPLGSKSRPVEAENLVSYLAILRAVVCSSKSRSLILPWLSTVKDGEVGLFLSLTDTTSDSCSQSW